MFDMQTAVDISSYSQIVLEEAKILLQEKCLKIEAVLDDIPVLEANDSQTQKIRFGQACHFDTEQNFELIWVRNNGNIIAIGSLHSNNFKSSRVFNLNYGE